MSVADAVLSLVPTEKRLERALGFLVGDQLTEPKFTAVSRLFSVLGMRSPRRHRDAAGLSTFDKIAAAAIACESLEPADLDDPEVAIAQARKRSLWGVATRHVVSSRDGARLSVIRIGEAMEERVLVIGTPGMPVELLSGWLRGLGKIFVVSTWETRGLFGPNCMQVTRLGIDAQLDDAEAVMDENRWPTAHVVSVCGGAALALAFAARVPHRVLSLGLWFGDYEFSCHAQKTEHQRNLQALMQMVVDGQVPVDSMHTMILRAMTQLSEPDLAPLALYPYANAELFGQYCHMNNSIMSTDLSPLLDRIEAPAMVVYSPDDNTTHIDGSKTVASALNARVESVRSRGHLHVLRGRQSDVDRALRFVQDCCSAEGRGGAARGIDAK